MIKFSQLKKTGFGAVAPRFISPTGEGFLGASSRSLPLGFYGLFITFSNYESEFVTSLTRKSS
jgi:hypothetical protein